MTIPPKCEFSFTKEMGIQDMKSAQGFFCEFFPDFSFKIATSAGWVDLELL